ncbi:MAG: bifunctional enoyl-CoA hydratase/phosphate acetyltransferase [Spirochaetaceae bacterium]|nr:MAG: bifunctional enoyl-CoA hydratase/phosphate acetyltransferase [Spirochaetaceae bacterium]
MYSFERIMEIAKQSTRNRVAVAWPHDADSMQAILLAISEDLAEPVLVGDPRQIRAVAGNSSALDSMEIIEETDPASAAATAVGLVREGRAEVLMKGLLETSVLLKAVLDPQRGLRTGRILSHVALFQIPARQNMLLLSDAAMNIAPDTEHKRQIVLNAVGVAHALGLEQPAVAMLCAKEKVNPRMPATIDAERIRELNRSGEISGCIVSGPLALDNAISSAAARQKGIDDPVAGRADILIAPNVEAGNILYKALVFLGGAANAGIIVGAAAPIVLTSRADSRDSKLASIALAVTAGRRQ